jgi:hypothetical protein
VSILLTPLVDQLIHDNSLPSQYGAKSVSAVDRVGARRALQSGDPAVRTIAGAYVAPDWRWQRLLAKPILVGRPRKDEL